jgi:hypothetical protein
MQTLRFPFYFRTVDQCEKVRDLANRYNRQIGGTLIQKYPYRFRQCEVKFPSGIFREGTNRTIVPKNTPGTKKWIGVLTLPTVAWRSLHEPDVNEALLKIGLEPVEKVSNPQDQFQSTVSTAVTITSKSKMEKLASMLDKKVGQGNWRMRGHHGYKKQLAQITGSRRKGLNRVTPKMPRVATDAKGVPVTIHISSDSSVTQNELEKMIFTLNLKS